MRTERESGRKLLATDVVMLESSRCRGSLCLQAGDQAVCKRDADQWPDLAGDRGLQAMEACGSCRRIGLDDMGCGWISGRWELDRLRKGCLSELQMSGMQAPRWSRREEVHRE